MRYCKAQGIQPHPARYPAALPELFIRMLTDPGDLVVDPFAGSCVTGEVCERIGRRWLCIDLEEQYLRGALGRFKGVRAKKTTPPLIDDATPQHAYKVYQPGYKWNGAKEPPLPQNGGSTRPR